MALDKLVDSTQLDACMTAEANAIRAKTGGSSDIAFDFANNKGFADAIAAIPSGGGGSGYAKKTGSFVLAEDYKYSSLPTVAYTGSILIDTGLSKVEAVVIWSEEWASATETTNCFGISCGFDNGIGVATSANDILHYYSGCSFMRNGSNNLANAIAQGIVFHSFNSGVPEGSFGVKCYNANFPIRAGHTIKWEAWGTE